jgi:murein DD-endopeptidase MepM/ murein hydrolase activator NlpD
VDFVEGVVPVLKLLLNFKIMRNIDNWLTNHKTEVFVVFILLFIFLFLYIPYRPGFLKVKSTPERLSSVETKMDSNFEKLFKRMDKQDSVLSVFTATMERVPKIFPVPGAKVSSNYGETRDSVKHWGLDISNKKGAPIYSPVTGTVISAKYDGGYGNRTVLDSGRFKISISHQDKMYVVVGQLVAQGQLIGTVGNTGNSTGAHEHIEIEQDGKRQDPKPYMQ